MYGCYPKPKKFLRKILGIFLRNNYIFIKNINKIIISQKLVTFVHLNRLKNNKPIIDMSYICENCVLRPENCICSSDITEPRLELELSVADNIMAVENSKPYGLLNAPSPSSFFSLLLELEEQENKLDLGTLPELTRHNNNIPEHDEPLICDGPMLTTPIKSINLTPPIPKLERHANISQEIQIEDKDLQDLVVELFPEEDEIQYPLYCETCSDFYCECDKMVPCDCGALYHINEPYGMCAECEMAYRRQDSIDQELYPDDIRERYNSYDSY
jgi:hypothetical protein